MISTFVFFLNLTWDIKISVPPLLVYLELRNGTLHTQVHFTFGVSNFFVFYMPEGSFCNPID